MEKHQIHPQAFRDNWNGVGEFESRPTIRRRALVPLDEPSISLPIGRNSNYSFDALEGIMSNLEAFVWL